MNLEPFHPEYHDSTPEPDNQARLGQVIVEMTRVYDQLLNNPAHTGFVYDRETDDEHVQLLLATIEGKKGLYPLNWHNFLQVMLPESVLKVIMIDDDEEFELVLSEQDETACEYISIISDSDERCHVVIGDREADTYAPSKLHELSDDIMARIERVANDLHALFAHDLNDPHAGDLPDDIIASTRPYKDNVHPSLIRSAKRNDN